MSASSGEMKPGYIVIAIVVAVIAISVFCCLSFRTLVQLFPDVEKEATVGVA